MAASADGTRIAWHRYGGGERTILFVPTWNLVGGGHRPDIRSPELVNPLLLEFLLAR